MKRLEKQTKQTIGWFALSCLLPIGMMAIAYFINGIYFGSTRTILASDSFSQYANFHASFNNVLHGKQSIFYTWYASLGLNYWSFSAYYLNGIFTPIVFFFDNQAIPDALYIITLLKFGAMGGAFWVYSKQTFKLSNSLHMAFSTVYALMAYTTAYSIVIMWLDAFVYLPLVILGINRLIEKQKPILLFSSYLCLFISNFYLAFIIGVFSFLYFFVRLFTTQKKYQKRLLLYLSTSLLAGMAAMITILPTVIDLKNNGESLTSLTEFWQSDTGIWDLVIKSMVGVYDTSKFESAPFLYVGLVPLILCLFYFIDKQVPVRNKLLYGGLFLLLIASVYISGLNLFWHGFHAPNMFLYRFSFLISFLMLMVAGYSLEKIRKRDMDKIVNVIFLLLFLFFTAYFFGNKQRYAYVSSEVFIINILLLTIYMIGFVLYQRRRWQPWVRIGLAVLMIGEAGYNAQVMIAGISEDWGYPSRIVYEEHYKEISSLVNQVKKKETGFYRLENLDPVSNNDSFNYGYSGVTMFSSIRNRHSSAYLNSLGYRSSGSNLNIKYVNNTLIMDSLLGIKYNLSKQPLNKYGYKKIATQDEYSLYENQLALPLGMMTDEGIYPKDAVNSQTELLAHLAGKQGNLFSFSAIKEKKLNNLVRQPSGDTINYVKEDLTKEASITWSIDIPANVQAYLSIVAPTEKNMAKTSVTIATNGLSKTSSVLESGQYYDLGYFQEAKTIEVVTTFATSNATITLYEPDAAFLNGPEFEKTIQQVQKKGVTFDVNGRKAKTIVTAPTDQVLLTTIPYDQGWTVYVDGKKIPVSSFKQAFLTVKIPTGTHKVEFIFLPKGFKVGTVFFCVAIIVFLGVNFETKKQVAKAGKINEKVIQ